MKDEMPQEATSPNATSQLDGYKFSFDVSDSNSYCSHLGGSNSSIEELFASQSLTDSVTNFPERFGRSYHAYRDGSYAFPNDSAEQERLDLQNIALSKLTDGLLFFSPLNSAKPPQFILDIATGTGDWPIAMGDLFPEAKVIATDLSPIQPVDVPPNVCFFVEDSSEPWAFDHKFDYIHLRNTCACWSDFETQIAQQAFDSLNTNGWFEAKEIHFSLFSDDGTLDDNSALMRWSRELCAAAGACERPLGWMPHMCSILERVGFVDVQQRILKIPLSGWPKDEKLREVGQLWEQNMQAGLSGFSFALFHRVFNRTEAEIEVDLMPVRRELSDHRIHAYLPYYVVWGRKPHHPRRLAKPRMRVRR